MLLMILLHQVTRTVTAVSHWHVADHLVMLTLCWRQCWTGGNSGGGHCRWLVSMERRDEQDNIHLLHNTDLTWLESGTCTWILNRWCPPWIIPYARAAQFHFRPADYLPVHFGLNFLNPSYIYLRACNIIQMCSLHHSVHKSTIYNANLCKIG